MESRLTFVQYVGPLHALYDCACGNPHVAFKASVKRGDTKSCGCLRRETSALNKTHSMARTPTYNSWVSMKTRCTNANTPYFINYGGRGIKVCDRWINSFENFLEDMGVRPKGTSLDRIDVNGDYSPENCRWASAKEQGNNTRFNVILEMNGVSDTYAGWEFRTGIHRDTIRKRINAGWTVEKSLTTKGKKQ